MTNEQIIRQAVESKANAHINGWLTASFMDIDINLEKNQATMSYTFNIEHLFDANYSGNILEKLN